MNPTNYSWDPQPEKSSGTLFPYGGPSQSFPRQTLKEYMDSDSNVDKEVEEAQVDPTRLEKAKEASNPLSFAWKRLSESILRKTIPFPSKKLPWEEPEMILFSPEGRPYHKVIDKRYLESCPWAQPYLVPKHTLKEYMLMGEIKSMLDKDLRLDENAKKTIIGRAIAKNPEAGKTLGDIVSEEVERFLKVK